MTEEPELQREPEPALLVPDDPNTGRNFSAGDIAAYDDAPTDEADEAAPVAPVEDTDPVELEEGPADQAIAPPGEWGEGLTDEDLDERLDGVEITDDPEDGATEDTN